MAFVRFPAHQVHWSQGPDTFASSNVVERGFCRTCGTSLSYREVNGPNISLAINSLDDPESVRPEWRFSVRTQVSWCSSLSSLATREMEMTDCAGFVSCQYRGRAANQC
jgi:hypothetical protein